jgi:hypothetical protein
MSVIIHIAGPRALTPPARYNGTGLSYCVIGNAFNVSGCVNWFDLYNHANVYIMPDVDQPFQSLSDFLAHGISSC